MKKIFPFLKEKESPILIIAEVGCNHNGDLAIAKELVRVAAQAGADVVKFQSFIPEHMITENSPKADYQINATGTKESQYKRLERLKLSEEDHKELIRFCQENRIVFCSSPFDHNSAKLLAKLDIPFFKIASGEITNIPLLKQIGRYGKPVVLSTGMANLDEIETALEALDYDNRDDIVLMHCLSDYPAHWKDLNLRAITTLGKAFKCPVGFSDHTEGIEMALVAVALGAVVIEKHITLDRNMDGGDHKASLEPEKFKEFVKKLRLLPSALGDGVKKCAPSEENVIIVARKSVVARKSIQEGSILKESDLVIKRPGSGISPKHLEKLVGAKVLQNIEKDQLLSWNQLKIN